MTQRSSGNDQFSVNTSAGDFDASATQPLSTAAGLSQTSQYGSTGQSTGQSTTDQVRQTAGQVTDQAKQQAGQLADQARQQVSSRLTDQKARAAESISGVAQALRQTSQQMGDQDQGQVTQYIDRAADQIERLSGYLQNKDVSELVNDVESYARRQPGLFLGGAFVLGLLGARFLKSSTSGSSSSYSYGGSDVYQTRRYGQGYPDTTAYGQGYTGTTGTTSYGGPADYGTTGSTTGYNSGTTGYNSGTTGSATGYGTTGSTTGSATGFGTGSSTTGTTSSYGTTSSTTPGSTNDTSSTSTRQRGGTEEL